MKELVANVKPLQGRLRVRHRGRESLIDGVKWWDAIECLEFHVLNRAVSTVVLQLVIDNRPSAISHYSPRTSLGLLYAAASAVPSALSCTC